MPIVLQVTGPVPAGKSQMAGFSCLAGFEGLRHLSTQAKVDLLATQYNWDHVSAKVSYADFLSFMEGLIIPEAAYIVGPGASWIRNESAPGSFTATDRAMLDDIATKAELANALTGTVNSINSQAALNRDSVIAQCHN